MSPLPLSADLGRFVVALLVAATALAGCDSGADLAPPSAAGPAAAAKGGPGGGDPPPSVTKPVSFAILEDYDKGQDLNDIALDFQMMNDLGVDVLRCSFGWDDYEPAQGQYDFAWLEQFVALADQYGIQLRPYLGYTAPWAANGGSGDGTYWNDPPADLQDWYDFVYALASALSDNPNVLSYEIYNEENDSFWWDGTVAEYNDVLAQGAAAVRAADADAEVILGGFVFPEFEWIDDICSGGNATAFDVAPFHAYPETWSRNNVTVESYLDAQYTDWYVPAVENTCAGQPIWINEMGFATTPGKTEADQANWWARAVSTFLADPEVEHIGVYEIKDLPEGSEVIGDEANYYLGLSYTDRTPKLAYHTVDLLTDLLDTGTITTADAEAAVEVTSGPSGRLYHHLFKRPDGAQVLFVYDTRKSPTVSVTLETPGATATRYALDGTATAHGAFDGTTLSGVSLSAGTVAIFRIDP